MRGRPAGDVRDQVPGRAGGRVRRAGPDDAQGPAQVKLGCPDLGQPACGQVIGDGQFADDRGRRAGQHGRADRRGGGNRQRGGSLGVARAEGGGQRRGQGVPGPRAAFPADQGSGGQLRGADPAATAPPGMAGSDDDGEPVMADDPAAQPGGPPRSLDEAQIRGPLGDVADDRLGVDRGQHDIEGRAARVAGRGPERRQPGRQQLLGDGRAGADPQPAAPVSAQRGDPGVQPGRHLEQPGRPLRDHRALGGQGRTARAAAHQRHAGLRLHGPDPRRNRLLAHADLLGGAVQAAGPGHAEQHLQRAEVGDVAAERHAASITRYKPALYPVKRAAPTGRGRRRAASNQNQT